MGLFNILRAIVPDVMSDVTEDVENLRLHEETMLLLDEISVRTDELKRELYWYRRNSPVHPPVVRYDDA